MPNKNWCTLSELSKEYGVPSRTLHNRLKVYRDQNPACYRVETNRNNHSKFYYNMMYITKEMVTKRPYTKKTKAVDYTPPPIIVQGEDGTKYNLVALKALLRVVTNRTLFEKFTGMLIFFWVCVIWYFYSKLC